MRFAVIGGAWRTEFFLRLVHAGPVRLQVTGVLARRDQTRVAIRERWGVRTCETVEELLAARPQFAVAVSGEADEVVVSARRFEAPMLDPPRSRATTS